MGTFSLSLLFITVIHLALIYGTKIYFIDQNNWLNRSAFSCFISVALLAIIEFGLLLTDTQSTAVFLGGVHTKVVITITFFFTISIIIFVEQKRSLSSFFRTVIIPSYLISTIIMMGSQLGPISRYASHVIYENGLWKYQYNIGSWTYPYFLGWLGLSVGLSVILFLSLYTIKLKQNGLRNKIFLVFAFVIVPVAIIYNFGITVNEGNKGTHIISPALTFCILAISYVFSNYQLFQLSPLKAFNNIMESINNQVIITDNNFKVTYLNRIAIQTFPNSKHAINEAMTIQELFQISQEEWINISDGIVNLDDPKDFEKEISINSGDQQYDFLLTFSKINDKRKKHNNQIGYAFVATDITKAKRHKKELLDYANQLNDKNIALERFAYIASHDLKTPIRNIVSFLGLMKRKLSPEEFKKVEEYFNFVNVNAHNLHQLVNDVLEYSRLNNREKLRIETIDFYDIVNNSMRALGESFQKKNAVVECNELPKNLMGDQIKLTQLFQNLFENSLKYNESQQVQIDINYEKQAGYHQFKIKDNGIGIDPEFKDRIFEMFKRLHTVDKYEGTGIGLATCKKIVEMHQGQIWLEDNHEQGTTFVVKIKVV